METLFFHYIVQWHPLGYVLIFIGVMLEGDLVLLTSAFFTRLHYFGLFNMFLAVLAGTYTGDLFYFWLGRMVKRSNNPAAVYFDRLTGKVHLDLEENLFRTLFIARFAYGTYRLTLIKSAIEGVPFLRYMRNIFLASFLWIVIVGSLGYFFAASFLTVRHYFKYAEMALLAGLVIYFIIFKRFSKKVVRHAGD
jgi:membrane protein DedA with SNARE-associated domain